MIDLVYRNTTQSKAFGKAFFEHILATAVRITQLHNHQIEISVSLVGDQRIRTLNRTYRKKDVPTDVLSFPLLTPSSLKPLSSTPKNAILHIGDIFISLPTAKRYARRDSMRLKDKLTFLTVHGFLHLLGYDHERSKQEEKKMFALQDTIIKRL